MRTAVGQTGGGNSKCKGPEVGVYLVKGRPEGQCVWSRVRRGTVVDEAREIREWRTLSVPTWGDSGSPWS